MSNKKISRAILIVEIEGKCYQVALQKDRMDMLVNLSASLSDNGVINVVEDPIETIEFK